MVINKYCSSSQKKLYPKNEDMGGMSDFLDLDAWLNSKSRRAIDHWGPSGLKTKVQAIERYRRYFEVELKSL